MGTRHLMVTSWMGIEADDLSFGGGMPAEVGADMWGLDGLVVIMDGRGGGKGRYGKGLRVRVVLEEGVMTRVITDTELRSRER